MLAVDGLESSALESSTLPIKEEKVKPRKHDELQYLNMIQYILDNGMEKGDRTGTLHTCTVYRAIWSQNRNSRKLIIFQISILNNKYALKLLNNIIHSCSLNSFKSSDTDQLILALIFRFGILCNLCTPRSTCWLIHQSIY